MPASGGMLFDFVAVGRPNTNSAMQNVGFLGCICRVVILGLLLLPYGWNRWFGNGQKAV